MKWTSIILALSAISTQVVGNVIPKHDVEKREFKASHYNCGDDVNRVSLSLIEQGIDYLKGVGGKPAAHGKGCGRVSCSYGAAIFFCNQENDTKYLKSFDTIASGAQFLVDHCGRQNGQNVKGEVYAPNGWSVKVKYDYC